MVQQNPAVREGLRRRLESELGMAEEPAPPFPVPAGGTLGPGAPPVGLPYASDGSTVGTTATYGMPAQ